MKQSSIALLAKAGMLSLFVLTGCSQSDNKTSQATTTPSSAVAVTSAPAITATAAPTTTAINAVAIDPKNFAGHETAGALAVAMSNFMVKNLNEVSDLQKLPADKKTCLLNSNHTHVLPIFDSYFAKKLSTNELQKTNAFYASALGQKLIVASDQKIKQQAGLTFSDPVTLSEDDTAKLKAFSTTPEGKKLMALFSPANQLEMQRDVIEPMMKIEFEKCDVTVAGMN